MAGIRQLWRRWRFERRYGRSRPTVLPMAVLAIFTVVVAAAVVWLLATHR